MFLRRGRDKNNHVNELALNGEDENWNGEAVLAVTQKKTQSQATLGWNMSMTMWTWSWEQIVVIFSSWFFHKLQARP